MSVPAQSKGTVVLVHSKVEKLLTGAEDFGQGGILPKQKCQKVSFREDGENNDTN